MRSDLFLDLQLESDWDRVDNVRRAVGHTVAAVFGDDALQDEMAMVTAELLENALKYGKPDTRVRLSIHSEAQALVVTVENSVKEGSQHLQTLQSRLRWLQEFDEPFAAYTAALRQVYERRDPDADGSGLGFARISYEGHCSVACDLSRPGRVAVSARRDRGALCQARHL